MAIYKDVQVIWHDDPLNSYAATVCIDGEWVEGDDDDQIFFYFDTQESFESAKVKGDNGFEFSIEEQD